MFVCVSCSYRHNYLYFIAIKLNSNSPLLWIYFPCSGTWIFLHQIARASRITITLFVWDLDQKPTPSFAFHGSAGKCSPWLRLQTPLSISSTIQSLSDRRSIRWFVRAFLLMLSNLVDFVLKNTFFFFFFNVCLPHFDLEDCNLHCRPARASSWVGVRQNLQQRHQV